MALGCLLADSNQMHYSAGREGRSNPHPFLEVPAHGIQVLL